MQRVFLTVESMFRYRARNDVRDTLSLVKAYNQTGDPEEKETMLRVANVYVKWYEDRSGQGCIDDGLLDSYAALSGINAECPEAKKLLLQYFNGLCNRIMQGNYGDGNLFKCLYSVLQQIDVTIFDGDTTDLLTLARRLLRRIRGMETFFKSSYQTYGPLVASIHQIIIISHQISPQTLRLDQKDGFCEEFQNTVRIMIKRVVYYPFFYQIKLIEQGLERLTSPIDGSGEDAVKRLYNCMSGLVSICHGIRNAVTGGADTRVLEHAAQKISCACKEAGQKSWYDILQVFNEASRLTTSDPEKIDLFNQSFEGVVQAQERSETSMRGERLDSEQSFSFTS